MNILKSIIIAALLAITFASKASALTIVSGSGTSSDPYIVTAHAGDTLTFGNGNGYYWSYNGVPYPNQNAPSTTLVVPNVTTRSEGTYSGSVVGGGSVFYDLTSVVPTMQAWAYITLVLLLVALAAKFLPRKPIFKAS